MQIKKRIQLAAVAALSIFAAAAPAAPGAAGADEKVSYNRDIRPILSDNCFYCHGPDAAHREADLRLDVRDAAVAAKAFVPGDAAESELVKRIFSADPDELMPPPKSHKKLTDAQKDLFKRWVAQGAEYQPHWSYIPPKRDAAPAVKDAKWARNPIDAFVLSVLESKKLSPSKEADRRTLLRRLSLDLIGLPPTPAEVRAFVDDKSPDAYQKQVERLLASPHFGERMAVPWLDAVRFADTVGFHGDQNQNVFPYRDYVINAFNANKPFDQFTIEQIAGDLLPNPTVEQRVATGFNRLTMMTREGGAQSKEYLAKYAADRVRTVGTAWLGQTLGCAECHDHKFDPITAKDFYSMAAFFSDVKQWGVYMDYGYTPNPALRGWSNDHPFPPELVVDSPYLQKRERQLVAHMDALAAAAGNTLRQDDKRRDAYDAWRRDAAAFLKANPSGWLTLADADAKASKGGKMSADGTFVFTDKPGSNDRIELKLPAAGTIAAIRLEVLPQPQHGEKVVRGDKPSATVDLAAAVQDAAGKKTSLAFGVAEADRKDERYAHGSAILGFDKNGWRTSTADVKSPQTAVYLPDAPAAAAAGDALIIRLDKNSLAGVRVSVSMLAPLKPKAGAVDESIRATLADAKAESPAAWRTYFLSNASADPEITKQLRGLQREVLECRDGKSPTLVTEAWQPVVTRVLPRGNWQDETGEIVQPAPLHFLPGYRADPGRRLNRLDLAQWIVSADNPLTGRTIVNRFWDQFFGAGLTNSLEDLGAQGEPPSHPELLDWLTVEFRDPSLPGASHKWDVKHIVRLMVTSAAYRQDSNLRRDLASVDPDNRLLSSQSPRRLEAEFVRDNALFAAGLLHLADLGGPSAKPYQPAGYYENLQFPSRGYTPDPGERQYRRGVYTHWQRTFLHPMLANFDAPSREDTICNRIVSNTPQQALTLLNDPTFVEAARALAATAMTAAPADDARLATIFERALSRQPKPRERGSLTKFLAAQRDYFKATPADATKLLKVGQSPAPAGVNEQELAAWTAVARVVLNLHETITRY